MFIEKIGEHIPEVSHKLIENPQKSVYFNHIHNHAEMLLFLRGRADYNIDGQIYSPLPYDFLFIPKATYHYLMLLEPVPYENYVIGISPALLKEEHYQKLFSDPLVINIKEETELRSYFTRLDLYHSLFSREDFAKCAKNVLGELITYAAYRKDSLRSTQSDSIAYVDKMISYIAEHIEEPLDAESIAQHFLLSKSYVQNMFSQSMHIGLKKYIMQKKIYAAREDLEQGLSPSEACEKYAFGDYSVFYRLYKKTFFSSPGSKK